jgi:hypothetical protein
MMFENAYKYLGLQYAKIQFKSDIDQVQMFTEFMTGAKSALIVLPVGYEEANIASNAIRAHRKRLSHLHLTVVHSGTRATSLVDFPKCEVIRTIPTDVNRFFLPSKPLLQRVLVRPYDVAVDMNLDFVLHTAYICKASRAKVRVGLARGASDVFFNVSLNLQPRRTPEEVYDAYANSLAMF